MTLYSAGRRHDRSIGRRSPAHPQDSYRAQDAVQETLVGAGGPAHPARPDRFDAWLHRLFLNACRDELRSVKRRSIEVELPEIHPLSVPDSQSASADRDLIERGVRHLDQDQRTVIVLHYYLGLPLPDAAAAMGIPLGTAKSRLHRATQALRAALDSDARSHPELTEGRS
jgi:RNA polymerase sigma-70 factor (ECF subfamily)